jgi:tetratricopeptide (TPR) repeat protein
VSRWSFCTSSVAVALLVATAYADDLGTPAPEVHASDVKVDLPATPSFDLPAGALTVRRLRVAGKALLGQRVVLHGVVTFAYDCVADVRKSGETDRAVRARIDADPTLCQRPKLYIGDAATTPTEKSLWIVDVPRTYNKLELTHLSKADRNAPDRCEPGEKDPAKQVCPPYQVGDEVIVAGRFDLTSPHSERNSDGLVVYEAMQNVTRKWQTPGVKLDVTNVSATAPARATAKLPPLATVKPQQPVDPAKRGESLSHMNDGNKALAQRKLGDARAELTAAVQAWDGNHLAWYGLGLANALDSKWREASDALAHAVTLRPDPMYRMWLGITLSEQQRFDDALAQLAEAVHVVPALWRAHYYLGRIARETERPRDAADEFARAITNNSRYPNAYVALTELLRKWDYTDQAIQVATQGTQNVPGAGDAADVWFVLGLAYADRGTRDKAIEAYTHALDGNADHYKARFQRGLAYFQLGDFAKAKSDLEAFVKADSKLDFEIAVAHSMLMDIAAKPKRR